MAITAGYSGTPLIKKLGIKQDFEIGLVDAPRHYFELLETDPKELKVIRLEGTECCDFILYLPPAELI